MTYTIAIISTLAAWFVGLFADVNIDFGDPQGFLALRVLFPVLAMEICILKALKERDKKYSLTTAAPMPKARNPFR